MLKKSPNTGDSHFLQTFNPSVSTFYVLQKIEFKKTSLISLNLLAKLISSFKNACIGIAEFYQSGTNVKIETICAIAILIIGSVLGFEFWEWLLVILWIAMVLSLEGLNTAIEILADVVTRDRQSSIRKLKDISAASVLIAAMGAFLSGILITCKHLIALFG